MESKLLGKYQLWENNVVKPMKLCFIKSFRSKDKKGYGIESTIWLGYIAEKQQISIKCNSYDGMCYLVFDEEFITKNGYDKYDKDCMKFTIKLIKELISERIIDKEPL